MLAEKICSYSFVYIFNLLVVLKIVACMHESILVYKNAKTRPSHHDKYLCSNIWASYALKQMDEVNDHYLGQPSHLTNYVRVNMIPLQVFTLQSPNETIFHGDFFPTTWQTKFKSSGVKIMRFPRYRHICLKAPGKCACNAINALLTLPRYRHTFSVSQECACNEYLLYPTAFMIQ